MTLLLGSARNRRFCFAIFRCAWDLPNGSESGSGYTEQDPLRSLLIVENGNSAAHPAEHSLNIHGKTRRILYEAVEIRRHTRRQAGLGMEAKGRELDNESLRCRPQAIPNPILCPRTTSVQVLGNRVADAVADGLRPHLGRYRLCRCTGYPDRRLECPDTNRSFAFEIKAKTGLDPRDTQRMILTSGTRKLRRNFKAGKPICHLLTTALYSVGRRGRRSVIRVHGLDFAFLEPSTLVQNQYEASVNQRLLAKGSKR